MYLKETGRKDVNCIHLAQDRWTFGKMALNLQVPYMVGISSLAE